MQPIDCSTAAERLSATQQNQAGHDAELDEAIAHVSQCPRCKERLGFLVRTLQSDAEDTLTCEQCQDQLPDYVQAQETGQADDTQWQAIALHLHTCPHCAAAHAELVELIQFAYGEQGQEPPLTPIPDLFFLPHRQIRDSWHWEDGIGLVIEFTQGLLRALDALSLQPAVQPAYAAVRTGAEGAQTLAYELREEINDLEVTITAQEEQTAPRVHAITVRVVLPGKDWPHLAGTQVTLKRWDAEGETQTTDAHGEAVFEGIAGDDLPRLVFEIAPQA